MPKQTTRLKSVPTATTFPIQIDPNGYAGHYYTTEKVANPGPIPPPKQGPKKITIDLPAGPTWVSVYGYDDKFHVNFTVLPDGQIDKDSIEPADAASASGTTLIFNTVKVEIDPGKFKGFYTFGGFESTSGPSTVRLIAARWAFLEIYNTGSNHEIIFDVSPAGVIQAANFPGATTCTQKTAKSPARVRINTRNVVLKAAPGVSGQVSVGRKDQVFTIGETIDLVVNYPVQIINKNVKWPGPDNILGESPGGDPLAPVPLFRFG